MKRLLGIGVVLLATYASHSFAVGADKLVHRANFRVKVTGSLYTVGLLQIWGTSPNLPLGQPITASQFRLETLNCGKLAADSLDVTANGMKLHLQSLGGGNFVSSAGPVDVESIDFGVQGFVNRGGGSVCFLQLWADNDQLGDGAINKACGKMDARECATNGKRCQWDEISNSCKVIVSPVSKQCSTMGKSECIQNAPRCHWRPLRGFCQ